MAREGGARVQQGSAPIYAQTYMREDVINRVLPLTYLQG